MNNTSSYELTKEEIYNILEEVKDFSIVKAVEYIYKKGLEWGYELGDEDGFDRGYEYGQADAGVKNDE